MLEANKYSYTSFGCLLIGRQEQMKGQGRLIGCLWMKSRRYVTT